MSVEKSYSLKEAANLLGISQSGLQNWIKNDKIAFYRAGDKLIRIKESEINKFSGQATGQLGPVSGSREEFRQTLREVLEEPEFAKIIRSIARKK